MRLLPVGPDSSLAEVRAATETWVEELIPGTWREAEARSLWLTLAWTKVRTFRGSSGDSEPEIQLLLRVGKLGKELGKALVGRLVQIPVGLAGTRAIVGRPELSRRVRFEILLSNPAIVTFEDLGELFEGYQGCDAELRMRILRRAHGLAHATLRTFLLGVIRDPSADYAEREEAVDALTTAGTPGGSQEASVP